MTYKSINSSKFIILFPAIAYSDAYTGKEDIKPDGKTTVLRQHNIPGRLYPFKTHNNEWDMKDRPHYWNGYGVDPSGVNYWHYYNGLTECYPGYDSVWDGTSHCVKEKEETTVKIPEPGLAIMTVLGILIGYRRVR